MMLGIEGSGGDNVLTLAQYGFLGLLLLLLISGKLRHEREVVDREHIIERQQAQLDSLIAVYQGEVIPTMVRTAEILARYKRRPPEEDR